MRRTNAVSLCLFLGLISLALLVKAAVLQVPSGTWAPTANLTDARANSSAALLSDGRILITGGDGASGLLATAEFFNTDGSVSAAAPMNVARNKHISIVLKDGRVLIAGGTVAGGGATNAAEIYDPTASTWGSLAGGMMEARSGATAGLLQDGRAVITGGQNGSVVSSTIEIFDPVAGSFSFAGALSSPRAQHATALLADGRVLIIGGSNGTAPVASTDIFDPVAGSVVPGPSLATPRSRHSATTLLDGRVLVAGGGNIITNPDGSTTPTDLASAEIFDPATGVFSGVTSTLATARQGHLAFLLAHNNNVLIVGGTSAGAPMASSELFTPWQGTFSATSSLTTARSNAAGSALQQDGLLLVAGGKDANGAALPSTEVYGFATVKTDQADYAPGTTVTITGSGWQPGETVTLTLVESPLIDTHGPFPVTADASGNISNSSFVTDSHDFNVKFTLTAVGSASQAQTTFTDAGTDTVTLNFSGSTSGTVTSSPAGVNCSYNGSAKSGTCSIDINNGQSVTFTGSTKANWSQSVSGWSGGNCSSTTTCTVTTGGNNSGTETVSFLASTTTTVSSSANPSVFGQPVTFTAAVSPSSATGTVTFKDGTTTLGTGALSGGTATFTIGSLTATSHSITAVYGGDSAFSGSTSSALTQTVNQASTTTALSSSANPSVFGQSVAFTATVSGVAPSTATVNTGTVQFLIDGVNFGSAVSVSGGTAISGATTTLSVGSHTITANYSDGTSYANSSGSLSGGQTVNQASTTTAVTASTNPSVFGQSVTFTATVNAVVPGSGTRTGTVQFVIDGSNFGSPVTLSGGTATSGATASLSQGTHTVTATYSGDTNFSTSASANFTQTVNKANTSTTVSSSASTSVFGQSVTFTATVADSSASSTGTPTGSVGFYVRASGATCASLGTSALIGTNSLNQSNPDTATATTHSLNASGTSYTILACYLGDLSFNTSSGTASQTVNKATTTTTVALISGTNPSLFGASLTFTATVTVNSLGSGTPTGTVNFRSNGTTITGCGTQTLNQGSPDTATCTTTALAVGTDSITAVYSSDSNFNSSTSSAITQTVDTLPNITGASSTNRFGVGGAVNCTGNNLTSLNCFTVTTTGSLPMTVAESASPDNLPTGVTYVDNGNGTGTLSGTPVANTNGTYNISFVATNAVGSFTQSFTLTVLPQPTSPSTPALSMSDPDGVVQPNTTITVTGTVDSTDSNDTVKVFDGLAPVGSQIVGTCSPTCPYSISFNIGTTAGTHSITATATDSIGNVSPASGGLVLTIPGAITPATIGTQTDDKGATTVTQTASISVGSNPSQMNTIIVTVAMDATTSNVTVGDSVGNTYTKDADVTNTGNIRTLVFSAPVTHALSSGTITVTFPSPTPTDKAVSFLSVNGLVTAAPQSLSQCGSTLISGAEDKCSTSTGNSTAPSSGSTATASQSDELLIGALGVFSQGVSYTSFGQSFQAVPSGFAQADAVLSIQPTYRLANAIGTYAASGSDNKSAPWAAAIVTYKIKFPTVSMTTTNQDLNGITPASINFTATFSQPVLGVDAADFALVTSGVSGASITGVTTTDNTVYTVTVSTGSGNGTIQLNYQDDNDTTVDANNIPLNGTVTPFVPLTIPGPVYTVDKSVATTTTVASSNNSPTYGTSVTFTATVTPASGTSTPTGSINFSTDGGASVLGTNAACPGGSPANSFCATYSTSSLTATNGTPHTVSASFAHSGIFLDSSGALSGGQTVSPKDLTIQPADDTKTYGATSPDSPFSGTVTGLVSPDTVNVTYGSAAGLLATAAVPGPYSITVDAVSFTTGSASNYNIIKNKGALTVNPVTVTITASSPTVHYGDPVPTITAGFSNSFVNGQTSAVLSTQPVCTTAYTTTSNAGTSPATSCSGAVATNYTFSYVPGAVTIQQVTVTITASSPTVHYGDPVPTITAGFSNSFVNGQTSAVLSTQPTCTTAYTVTSNAGTSPATSCSGAVATNYTFSYVPGTTTVNPAPLTYTATGSKTYGSTTDNSTAGSFNGFQNGQNAGTASGFVAPSCSSATGAAALANVGTYTINCAAGSADNYTLAAASFPNTFAVNPKGLDITANNRTKTYGDTVTFAGTEFTTGAGPPSAALGTGLGNYTISYHNASVGLTVNPATLTVTADNKTMILHDVLPTLTASYSGFKNGETLATSGVTGSPSLTTAATSSSPVGPYVITAALGTLAANNYTFAFVNGTLNIIYASGGICDGDAGHQILQPINVDGSSVWKQSSTVPAKFRVCDVNGNSIGTAGVVANFFVYQTKAGTVTNVDETNITSTNSLYWNFDPTGQQWIFNIGTKTGAVSSPNTTYWLEIDLNDGSKIQFLFGLK